MIALVKIVRFEVFGRLNHGYQLDHTRQAAGKLQDIKLQTILIRQAVARTPLADSALFWNSI